MLARTKESYGGQACLKLENESLAVWATTSVGPRLLGLALHGGENLFAVLPGLSFACPGVGAYHVYGGHRLWYAPEDPPRTYLPDDAPLEVAQVDAGVRLTQPVEPGSGIQKEITLRLPGPEARVLVEHSLYNRGETPVELAPWAITQLRTGGQAILPLSAPLVGSFGVLPNRSLVMWPYTDLSSPHLWCGKRLLRLRAEMTEGAFKVGFPNPSGWLAYLLGETLFVKYAPYQAGAAYFDQGSSSECYCDPRFIELESLGPRLSLAPGESVRHTERWALFEGVSIPDDEDSLVEVLGGLGLGLAGG